MKIKITTARRPWLDRPLALGEEVEVADEIGAQMVVNGFAEIVEAPKPTKGAKADA